jgi:hypothetical protein
LEDSETAENEMHLSDLSCGEQQIEKIDIDKLALGKRKKFILYPDEYFKLRWDIFVAILLIISVIVTPLDIAFPRISENS